MKYQGTYTDLDDDGCLDEATDDLLEVIVAKERLALAWTEGDGVCGLTLYPKPNAPSHYFGDMTLGPNHTKGYVTAVRYDVKDGGILLLAKWFWDDRRGFSIFELDRAE